MSSSLSSGLRATYDADHHILYIALPDNPGTPGCVKHTAEREGGVLYDIGHDDKVIGIEVMLAGPLEVMSGDNGVTRTGNAVAVPPAFVEDWNRPDMDAYNDA